MTVVFIILLLVALNGIFAMAEIAMVSARKVRLEKLAKSGDKAAKKALELQKNPSKFLSTVQIGITLIGILMGIYSGEKLEGDFEIFLGQFELFRPYSKLLSVTIIVIALTFLSLVFGELVPKRIGLTKPEKVSRIMAYPMYFISIIAMPFIWLLTFTTDLLIKIINIKKSKDSHITEEEIKAIIREGKDVGAVLEIEQEIVENVFHLGDRKIKSLMTHRKQIYWLNKDDPADKLKAKIIASPHKSFPVSDKQLDRVVGIVHSKDILNAVLNDEPFDLVKLSTQPLYLAENSSAYQSLEKFIETKERIALVVDEYGGIEGILTMNDLIDALTGDLLEQLHENKEIIPRDDGSYLIDASLPVQEFTRYFELDVTDDPAIAHVNTVGGLVFHISKKIPKTGEKFNWKSISIEIMDMDSSRIDKVLVKRSKMHQ